MRMPAVQVAMARTRYAFARAESTNRTVLEIASGTGFGLELLQGSARLVVGGDVTMTNLVEAKMHVPVVPLAALDAHHPPFREQVFDTVVIFEALYYFHDAPQVIAECRRVLRPGGSLLLSMPNPACRGFHASPRSTRYFSARSLRHLLGEPEWELDLYGGFPSDSGGWRGQLVSHLVPIARAAGVIPKDLGGRARIKRLVYGPLATFEGLANASEPVEPLTRLSHDRETTKFRVLYAHAVRK